MLSEKGKETWQLLRSEKRKLIFILCPCLCSHGNKQVFSCRGLLLAVRWFLERGLRDITVFVPLWRKEQPSPEAPMTGRTHTCYTVWPGLDGIVELTVTNTQRSTFPYKTDSFWKCSTSAVLFCRITAVELHCSCSYTAKWLQYGRSICSILLLYCTLTAIVFLKGAVSQSLVVWNLT